jgi:phosphomannomutase
MALTFGTAGIRGPMGPGPDEINATTIRAVARGVSSYLTDALIEAAPCSPRRARVVLGYDARRDSDAFALVSAATFAEAGHEALVLPRALPTPVLAFAVRLLGAEAGVMITASHNPGSDNGFKLYLGGRAADDAGRGAQIVPPADVRIQDRIADIEAEPPHPRVPGADASWTLLGDDIEEAYVRAVADILPRDPDSLARRASLRIVLTPVHGVGGATALAALGRAGFTNVTTVAAQFEPDSTFPTAPFPNPEEPGVMDLALAEASAAHADVAIALDPDADRCAVGVVVEEAWVTLHGDRVGCLLAESVSRALGRGAAPLGTAPGARTLASSVVSSRLVNAIAARHGVPHVITPTGFKWIARVPGLAFGYEEALGYCVAPEIARDKDGISAALAICELASLLAVEGRTISDALDDLDRTYGVHVSRPVSLRCADIGAAGATLARLLAAPPAALGGSPVVSVADLERGPHGLPPTTGAMLLTAGGTRVIVRPSGTEPKIKAYIDVIRRPLDDLASSRAEANALAGATARDVEKALEGS